MEGERGYRSKTEEDKGIIPLIGVLLVLIIIVAAALYTIVTQVRPEEPPPVPPPPVDEEPVINETNETNVTMVCDDQCHYDLAILNESAEECGKIADETLTQDCYEQLADVSFAACLEVDDEEKRDFCITAFAVSNDDIDLCDLLEDGDECRKQVDPCIGDEAEDLCRALREEDPALCLSDSDCLLNYSITKDDVDSCALIQNPVIAAGCESALKKTDRCYDLELKAQRDYCYEIYAIHTGDYLVCTSISKDTIYRLNCLSHFAASEGNYSICDIGSLQLDDRWACYTNYSLMSGDLSGCWAIHELATTNRYKCASAFAQKYGNPAACIVVQSLPSRSTCYQGAIIYYNENLDPQYCKDITNFNWRNKCYNEAAKLYDDVTICEGITDDGFAYDACVDAYYIYKSEE